MTELSNAHANHLKPQFIAEDMEEEQTIEILTEQITKVSALQLVNSTVY